MGCRQFHSGVNGLTGVLNIQGQVVQKVDNAIHWINHYPVDSMVCFVNIYPLDSDFSGGQRYPAFEQLGQVFSV